ncbi:MAG: hypothetical protein HY286_00230 [Planctomycetes bacterium]|nr:hypothetical protein [Planctomycetota bacterium]
MARNAVFFIIAIALAAAVWIGLVLFNSPPAVSKPESSPAPPLPEPATARAVMTRLIDVYTECKSYRDDGSARMTVHSQPEFVDLVHFKTAFVRPDRLSFTFKKDGSEIEESIASVFKETKLKTGTFLSMAHSTHFSSSLIPLLLLDSSHASNIYQISERLADLKLESAEVVDGSPCFVLRGSSANESDGTFSYWLFVDRSSFLMRRIKFTYKPADGIEEDCEIIYHPEINV